MTDLYQEIINDIHDIRLIKKLTSSAFSMKLAASNIKQQRQRTWKILMSILRKLTALRPELIIASCIPVIKTPW